MRRLGKLFLAALGWFFGVIFFIEAIIGLFQNLLTALIFGCIGFILLPPGHLWIEKHLNFRVTTKNKSVLIVVLFVSAYLLSSNYNSIKKTENYRYAAEIKQEKKGNSQTEKEDNNRTDLKTEQQEKVSDEQEQKVQNRNDSFGFYIQETKKFENAHNIEKASKQLEKAFTLISTEDDNRVFSRELDNITGLRTFALIKSAKYQTALSNLSDLLSRNPSSPELIYYRAICYSKTGKIQEAVSDCKEAMQVGYTDAETLYNKINPIRKRVLYYLTRCCDGTISPSNAKGRGACSWHGGVCNWNEPVYEEYRKY